MMKLPSILLIFFLCLTINMTQGRVPLSKSGCLEKCGSVTIPYPFGIGAGCSASSLYTVLCKNDTKPFLTVLSSEVLEISLDVNMVRVMYPISILNCSLEQKIVPLGRSIEKTPFTFSSRYNSLAVVGCKCEAWLMDSITNDSSSFGGCSPVCGHTTFGCNGINCCQTKIPNQFQELLISYTTSRAEGVCGIAFLVESYWLANDYKNYRSFQNQSNPLDSSVLEYVPVILDWEFDGESEHTPPGVICRKQGNWLDANDRYSIRSSLFRCHCEIGYEGNPYLPGGGCQDINECSDPSLNNCIHTCINTVGSFTCQGQDGYHQMKSKLIGIIISSGIGALLLLGGAGLSLKVIRKRIKENRKKRFFKRNGGLLLQQQLSSGDVGIEKTKLFTSKELTQATDHYNENRILGRGGQGTVYKGMLADGKIVAVKKSQRVDEVDIEVFINEVVILSQINHRNVVKLLGCCLETEVPLLVYEFISSGTLFQHIHAQNDEFRLSWRMRLRIAAEVAGALSYLHSAASTPIYHRDIKSTNILLDDKYRAKVSDFGTSRSIAIDQTHLTTRVLGTFGYLDPEYFQSSQFTEKSDVYSFGVVIVELLTGEKAISAVRDESGRSLATYFLHSMEENNLFDILEPELIKEGRTEELVAVAKLAMRCLNLNGKKRPTMKEVAVELEGIRMSKEGSVSPSNLEDIEFQSIEIFEHYDFPSTSNNTNVNVVTAEASESPLLLGNS